MCVVSPPSGDTENNSGPNLLHAAFLRVLLGELVGGSHAHLGGLEGLQARPHGPLEDLLHLPLVLGHLEVSAAVPVSVLRWAGVRTHHGGECVIN